MNLIAPIWVTNYKTGRFAEMFFVTNALDLEDISTIKEIFLQPECRKLFAKRLKGKAPTNIFVRHFINWAIASGQQGSCYVFLLRDSNNKIIGSVDIQRKNETEASIGFWSDNRVSGFMTNAVIEVSKVAKKLGFTKIDSYCDPFNSKAANVMLRAGFKYISIIENQNRRLLKYEKFLNPGNIV